MYLRRVLSLSSCFLLAAAAVLDAQSPKQSKGRSAVPPRKSASPVAPGSSSGNATNRSLEERIASVLPTQEEDRWLEIKWRTNIAAARAEAARENKPVFLWVMNGNPIGCG